MAKRAKTASSKNWKTRWIKKETGALLALTLIVIVFNFINSTFMSPGIAGTVLTPSAELGIVTIGATLLMIAGEFDLSVGAVFAMAGILSAFVTRGALTLRDPDTLEIVRHGITENPALAAMLGLLVALAFATSAGLLNGVLTLVTRIPSFIVTLGTMLFWRGTALFIAGGRAVSITRPEYQGNWFLQFIGDKRIDIPIPFTDMLLIKNVGVGLFWFLLLVFIFWYVLMKTRAGNWIFATGGKKEAAMALGVPVNRVKLLMFSLTGLLAGFAGSIEFARAHSMSPIEGTGLELEAIAASVIGGAELTGGVGTVIGGMLGALTLRTIRIGLPAIGLDSKLYQMVIGVILIIAVVVNHKLRAISERR